MRSVLAQPTLPSRDWATRATRQRRIGHTKGTDLTPKCSLTRQRSLLAPARFDVTGALDFAGQVVFESSVGEPEAKAPTLAHFAYDICRSGTSYTSGCHLA